MNPVMFNIFGLQIRWYSVMILLGIIVGFVVANLEIKRKGYDKDKVFDMAFWTILFGIFGARIYFVLFNLGYYLKNPLDIFKVWEGGLAIHGGIIFGLLTLIFYCKKNELKVLDMTDIIVPSLIIAQAIGRWGNFFNSEVYGMSTSYENLKSLKIIPEFVINGMKINGVYHQPLFFYESLWCLLGFFVLILIRKIFKDLKSGQLTCVYLIWYGIGRFYLENLREDEYILNIGNFKIAQIVSLLFVIIGVLMFIYLFCVNLKNKNK